ncbi:MAG TPA: hypothetical protein PLD46_03150 [Hyphomicrobium sp.]|nr:hypothetical protein [Hyphomicrobium sp.]
MNSELPVSADALLAERARLEEELQSSEDWCELLRLKSRKDRGEGMSAVNAARLEMVLIDALAEDETFVRYKAVCVALERLIRGLPPLPPPRAQAPVEKDDLTEIKGISASMARRLNALDVTTFMEIAEWSPADIKAMSADLGIGRQIYEQDWVGQAEELATRSDDAPLVVPAAKAEPPARLLPAAPPPPAQKIVPREAPQQRAPVQPMPVQPTPVPAIEMKAPVVAPLRPVAEKAVAPPAPIVSEAKKPEPHVIAAPQPQPQPPAPAKPAADVKPVEVATAAPVQPPAPVKSEPQKVEPQIARAVETAAADVSSKPLPIPPQPMRAETYSQPIDGTSRNDTLALGQKLKSALDAAKAAPSNTQPQPPQQQTPGAPAAAVVVPSRPLSPPPRPFVITRASLPKVEPVALPPARAPEPAQKANAPSSPDSAATAVLSAGSQGARSSSAAPSMSIDEAIAYAAEVARGPRAGAPVVQPKSEPPRQNTTQPISPSQPAIRANDAPVAKAPLPPPASPVKQAPVVPVAPPVRAAPPVPPAVPPPLPAGFVPPEPAADADRPGFGVATVQGSRLIERDDYRAGAEEATVEIVIKVPSEDRPTPRMALSKVATEKTATAPRPATPIGRFLKALTGN